MSTHLLPAERMDESLREIAVSTHLLPAERMDERKDTLSFVNNTTFLVYKRLDQIYTVNYFVVSTKLFC